MTNRFIKHFRQILAKALITLVCLFPLYGSAQTTSQDSLLTLLKQAKTEARKSELYNQLSAAAFSSDFKQALKYAHEAAFYAKKDGSHDLLMSAYKTLASVFYFMGVHDQAVLYFERCSEEAAKAGNEFEKLNNQLNIATIYLDLGQYQKAIKILEPGEQMLESAYAKSGREFPMADRIAMCLNLGASYLSNKEYGKGYRQIDKGIELARVNPSQQFLLAKLLLAKAKSLLMEKRTKEAVIPLKEGKVILQSISDKNLHAFLLQLQGLVEENELNYEKAISFYKDGYEQALALSSIRQKKTFTKLLAENYQKINQADSAIKYLNLYTSLDKESNLEEANQELLRKELLAEFTNRELQLERENKKNRFWIYLISALALLLAALAARFYLFKRKYNEADLANLKLSLDAEKLELERSRLAAQLSHQEKQLAEYEYKLSKNAMLEALVGELQTISSPDPAKTEKASSTQQNNQKIHQSKVWEEFELRFLQTHTGFYDRLLVAHTGLTANERRLCAFLRLDMTTKEISVITGQTVRAIEIARIRLRKKLNLTQSETSIYEYLSKM